MAQVNDDYPKKTDAEKQMIAAAIAQHESKKEDKEEVHDFPTEIVELPSKGLLYPEGHPLSDGARRRGAPQGRATQGPAGPFR